MKRQEDTRRRSLLALGAAGLAVAALLAVWALGSAGRASAAVNAGVNYTISADGFSSCNTSQGDAQCYIPPGTTFTLSVTLGPLPADIPSYEGFDLRIEYTGLTSADNGTTESWPDCGFAAIDYNPGQVAMGCSIGLDAGPSTYVGLLGTNDFTCSQSGTIALRNSSGNTVLIQDVAQVHSEPGDAETLNITCGTAPTPTPLPALGSSGSGGAFTPSESSGAGLWLAIGSLLALTGAASALTWTFARNRQ